MQPTKRSPFLTALFHPASLSMLVSSAAAGLCAAWWMAPIGLFFWLVVFIVAYRDPALRLSNTVAGRVTLAYRFQSKFDRVQKTQTSLFLALKSAPVKAQQLLKPVQDAVNALVDQTYHICQRFANVDNYITVQRANKDLEGEIAILELKLAVATDEHVRQEYEEALGTLREQADHLKRMTNLLERFETQLTTLTSTLERVQANAIRLQTMDEQTIRIEIPDLLKWIEVQSQELKGFEREAG
jgi:archaellum component FlaC